MSNIPARPARLGSRIVSGISFAVVASLGASCGRNEVPEAREDERIEAFQGPASFPSTAEVTIAPLGRAELLAGFAAAADAAAAGDPLPKANRELTNRTFEVRLPFSCGDGIAADWAQWSFDPKTRVLRITVRPQISGEDPIVRALGAGLDYDAAEGFWIERPWTRSERCPRSATAVPAPETTAPPPAPSQSIKAAPDPSAFAPAEPAAMRTAALVQYFSPDTPRNLRRGSRPYSYTGKLPGSAESGPTGFRLKLVGRLQGFPDGQPIHCLIVTSSRPPACAASVEFTQIVLEDATTGKSLSEWPR